MFKKIKTKYLLPSTFFIIFLLLRANSVFALEVRLQGLGENPTLGQYVSFIFSWAMGIAFTIAAISFAVGAVGLINPNIEAHKDAKDRMIGAVLGLVLTLSSYLILMTINPAFKTLDIDPLTPTATPATVMQPGVYFYLASGCSGENSGPITTPQNSIAVPFAGKIKSVKIINDQTGGIFYGAILHKAEELKNGGECLSPIMEAGCREINIPIFAADIFTFNVASDSSSGDGITFYSKNFGWNTGQNAGSEAITDALIYSSVAGHSLTMIPNQMCFDYTNINVQEPYKHKCTESNCGEKRDYSCSPDKTCRLGETCDAAYMCWGGTCKHDSDCTDSSGRSYPNQKCNTEIGLCVGRTCNPNAPVCLGNETCSIRGACVGENGKKLCSNGDQLNAGCETFQDCPGSIRIKGSYLVALYSKDATNYNYCQTFRQDVENLDAEQIIDKGGKTLELIYIISLGHGGGGSW